MARTRKNKEIATPNNIPSAPMTKPAAVTPEVEKMLAWLWHEEIKCLFLRCKAPPDRAIEQLVTKIFNYDLYSNSAEEVICHSKWVLTDFHSKLNKKIDEKVREFKEIHTRPTNLDITEFISQEVVEQILFRYLTGTDKVKLKKCGTMEKLVMFVREAFKVHHTAITMGCKIPSRSGKNIATRISLE